MQCVTVKKGVECSFMGAKGCGFNGGRCLPIAEACQGCARVIAIEDASYCNVAPDPTVRWRVGTCSFATHIERKRQEEVQKINPLKASKRAAAGKKK
jgi:hypothetical protein